MPPPSGPFGSTQFPVQISFLMPIRVDLHCSFGKATEYLNAPENAKTPLCPYRVVWVCGIGEGITKIVVPLPAFLR